MSLYGFPRSLSRGFSSLSMGRSARYGLLSSSKILSSKSTSKLQLKKNSLVSSSQSSTSSLSQSYLDKIKEQAKDDVKNGVSMEDGKKNLVKNSPLLKLLSSTNNSQFQKATNTIYEDAYQAAQKELEAAKTESDAESTPKFDVKV